MSGLKASLEGLRKIRQARERITEQKGWAIDNPQWLEEASQFLPLSKVSPGTVSIGTWKRFLSGKTIKAINFNAFCKILQLNVEEVVERDCLFSLAHQGNLSTTSFTFNQGLEDAVDIPNFHGRIEELTQLEHWIISDKCRVIILLGIGGIGKTALSIKLAQKIKTHFNHTIWKSLREAPPLTEVLADIINKYLSRHREVNLPTSLEERISCLINYLQLTRSLIILDNVESILLEGVCKGKYRPGFENYGSFFRRLGETQHQSCLVLTSRESPKELDLLEAQTLLVKSLRLRGLNTADSQKIIEAKGVLFSESEVNSLTNRCSGNPMLLVLALSLTKKIFNGSISKFLNEKIITFGGIKDLLDEHFNRLSSLEIQIMYWLSINREPTSIDELMSDIIISVSRNQVFEAALSLLERSLIEGNTDNFTLQNLIMEYTTNSLIELFCNEIQTASIKVLNYYTLIKATSKNYVRETQKRFFINGVLDIIPNLENKIYNCIFPILRTQPELHSGYLAGNILNILTCLKSTIKDLDFSDFFIRQAYLQDVFLYNLNFTNSNFISCVFRRTFSNIQSVEYSKSGDFLAAASSSGKILVWDTNNWQLIKNYQAHNSIIRTIAFSPDTKILVSGGDDYTIKIWNFYESRCLATLQHDYLVRSVAFSRDEGFLISGSEDGTVRIWQLNDELRCLSELQEDSNTVTSVSVSSDGKIIAFCTMEGDVKIWNMENNSCLNLLKGHFGKVWSVAFNPMNNIIATGGDDSTVRLWDPIEGILLNILNGHTARILSVTFSSDGLTLASGGDDNNIRLWDLSTGKCVRVFQGHTNRIRSLKFSPNYEKKILASGSEDNTIRLWDFQIGECIHIMQGYSNCVWTITPPIEYSKLNSIKSSIVEFPNNEILDGESDQILVSAGDDNNLHVWSLRTYKCLKTIKGHSNRIWAVALSSDCTTLISSSDDQTLRIWNLITDQCLILREDDSWILSVCLSPDNKLLATGNDQGSVTLWDVNSGQKLESLYGHTSRIWSVIFDESGHLLASGSDDKSIKIWNINDKICIHTLIGHTDNVNSVTFNPNRPFLVSGSADKTIRLWDLKSHTSTILYQHTDEICSVAFSKNGNWIASGGKDKVIKIWDFNKSCIIHQIEGHSGHIKSIVFNQDGSLLVSCGSDGKIIIWDVNKGVELIELRTPRPYDGINISSTKGLTIADKESLFLLGAYSHDFGFLSTFGDPGRIS